MSPVWQSTGMSELAPLAGYFGLTFVLATIFAMGGVGSAIGLVPMLETAGLPLALARALGLFVNTTSTAVAAAVHLSSGLLDLRGAWPLVVSVLVATPIGAWASQFVAPDIVRAVLAVFLIAAALLMLVPHRPVLIESKGALPRLLIGASVGAVSGLVGVGGGTLIVPALVLLGEDAKSAARTVSFVIPFSSAGGFLTYLQFVTMNWMLLAVVGVAAAAGGFLGGRLMNRHLNATQVKRLIAVLLLLLAAKLLAIPLLSLLT